MLLPAFEKATQTEQENRKEGMSGSVIFKQFVQCYQFLLQAQYLPLPSSIFCVFLLLFFCKMALREREWEWKRR